MLWNEVCGCRASGVFLRLSAAGLIAENNIHSNAEAGLDIRKGANPIILVTSLNSLLWTAADSWELCNYTETALPMYPLYKIKLSHTSK